VRIEEGELKLRIANYKLQIEPMQGGYRQSCCAGQSVELRVLGYVLKSEICNLQFEIPGERRLEV
jgi:hypothetical protein